MLRYKKIDLWIQPFLIPLPFLFGLIDPAIYCYFFVGGWQVLSVIIHLLFINKRFLHHERREYIIKLLWLLVIGGVCAIFGPALLFFLMGLLLMSPVFAIWYFWICQREIKMIEERNLVHLK